MTEKTRLLPSEAAEYIGCGYDWIMREARLNRIPHYRIGRRVFFTKETLALWIENQERKSMQEATSR